MHVTTFTPAQFKKHINQATIQYAQYQTTAGLLHILTTDKGIYLASFAQPTDYKQYLFIKNIDTTKFLLVGTDFQIKVWQTLLQIPDNTTWSYQELAQIAGYPRAWRAVANAIGQNNIAFFVPCHRIIRKNGELGGYRWGIEIKKLLLTSQQCQLT